MLRGWGRRSALRPALKAGNQVTTRAPHQQGSTKLKSEFHLLDSTNPIFGQACLDEIPNDSLVSSPNQRTQKEIHAPGISASLEIIEFFGPDIGVINSNNPRIPNKVSAPFFGNRRTEA